MMLTWSSRTSVLGANAFRSGGPLGVSVSITVVGVARAACEIAAADSTAQCRVESGIRVWFGLIQQVPGDSEPSRAVHGGLENKMVHTRDT